MPTDKTIFDTLPDTPAQAPVPTSKTVFDTLPDSAPQSAAPKTVFDTLPESSAPAQPKTVFDAFPSDAKIEAAQPSVWQRVKDMFTGGIPRYSTRTSANPEYGQMSLIAPQDALTPNEQRQHPVLTALYDFSSGMTTPTSVATLVATGGLGELPGAAGVVVPRLISAGFSAQQIYGAAKLSRPLLNAIESGDYLTASNLMATMGLNIGAAALGLRHVASGEGAVSKGKAESAPIAEEVAHEPASPVGRNLSSETLPPDVRLVDSEATKQHLENEEKRTATPISERPAGEVFVRSQGSTSFQPGANPKGYAAEYRQNVTPQELADLEKQAGRRLTNEEALRLSMQNRERGLMTVPRGGPNETEQIRAANKERLEKTAEEEGRYAEKPATPTNEGQGASETEAELRPSEVSRSVPTARTVSDDHTPVVSRNEILAQRVQTMVNNSAELAKIGVDPSQINTPADVTTLLNRVADHVGSNLDDRAKSVLTFDMQKQLAKELNMSVEDLLGAKSGQAFNAEQAVAARALLHESQNRVIDLAKRAGSDPSYMEGLTRSLAQHTAILEVVKGTTAKEAGRALGSFRIAEEDLPHTRITDALSKLTPEAQAKAAQLLAKIDTTDKAAVNQFIQEIKPSTPPDKLFELYRNALLSGPATVIKKGASEATMLALETTKKLVASGLSKDRFAAESYWFAKGATQALRHAKAILTGSFQLEDAPGFEETGARAWKGTLGKVIRMPSTILSKQTNLMYAMNYFGELNAQAARAAIREGLTGEELAARQEWLAHNPNEAMQHAAHEVALHNTFQQDLGKFGASVSRTVKAAPGHVGEYLFPFTKTPVNLVKASAEFSPYGLFKGIARGDVNQQAAGLVGSAIALAVAYAALNGHITGGGPVAWQKQQTLESTGWQPYSIKIGNKYYSYHRLEPLGLTFGLVADAIHGAKTGDDPEVTQSKADTAVAHIMRNASSLPFLYEMSALLQAIDDPSGRRVDNFVDRQIASFIPTGVADIAAATDRTVRHPSNLAETIESRIPRLTSRVPASIDISGKPLQRPSSALGGANPFPWTTDKSDPVVNELARLGFPNEQPPKTVKRPGTSKKVLPWALTPNESQQIQVEDARQLYAWLQKRVTALDWQGKSDDTKRALIQEERQRIVGTRYARVARMRRKTAVGE